MSTDFQTTNQCLIDNDWHEHFIELLSASREWLCDQTEQKTARVADAIIALNIFDPNPGNEKNETKAI